MPVVDINNKAEFDALVASTPYVALQAHATWCGPCKAISPFFTKHSDALAIPERYVFARFDTDEVPDLAQELAIRSIPAFFIFENGEKVDNLAGANPPALQKLTQDYATKAQGEASTVSAPARKDGTRL